VGGIRIAFILKIIKLYNNEVGGIRIAFVLKIIKLYNNEIKQYPDSVL
jgi:hypothetical protein